MDEKNIISLECLFVRRSSPNMCWSQSYNMLTNTATDRSRIWVLGKLSICTSHDIFPRRILLDFLQIEISEIIGPWELPLNERSAAYLPYCTSPTAPELQMLFFKIFFFFHSSKKVRTAYKIIWYLGWHKPQIDSSSAAFTTVALPSAKFSPIWPIFKATRSERLLNNVSWLGWKDNVWTSCHIKRK